MTIRKLALVFACMFLAAAAPGCGAVPEEGDEAIPDTDADEVAAVEEPLLLGASFEPWLAPPTWAGGGAANCPTYFSSPGTLNANGQAIQTILNDVVKRARMVANSQAYYDCLSDVMRTGSVKFPHDGANLWGPYCRPTVDTLCPSGSGSQYGFGSDADPLNADAFAALTTPTTDQLRASQARRVWALSATNSRLRFSCHTPTAPNGVNGPQNLQDPAFYSEEIINLHRKEWDDLLAKGKGAVTDAVIQKRAYFAALTWHEAMHGYGYDHNNSSSFAVRLQVPHIAGACMWQVMLDSNETVRASTAGFDCTTTTCAAGQFPIIQNYPATGCTCTADPGVFSASRLETDRGTAGPMVVDSTGELFRINGTTVQRSTQSGWVTIVSGAAVDQIYAGGGIVYYRLGANLYRQGPSGFTNVGAWGGVYVSIDGIGRAHRLLSSGVVERLNPGATTWTALTNLNGAQFLANKTFAGGTNLYATVANGDIYKYFGGYWGRIGGPGADFAVDSGGAIYGLSPDFSGVYAYRNNAWTSVRGATAGIIAGSRLYARSSTGSVSELYPNGVWRSVASADSGWAAGGSRLALKRGTRWYDYAHRGTTVGGP